MELTYEELIDYIKNEVHLARSQKEFANKIGFSHSYLNDVINGKKGVSRDFAVALGFTPVTRYHVTKTITTTIFLRDKEMMLLLREMVKAMKAYRMDVDEPAPYVHRQMMNRAYTLLGMKNGAVNNQ